MNTFSNVLANFFTAPIRGQTYLNMLYLFLSFPLGLIYFVFLVTGLSLGIGLAIVWVGLLVLLGVFVIWYGLLAFERAMAIGLLRESIPPMAPQAAAGAGIWKRFTGMLKNPVTWKGLLYLVAKLPLGIVSFVVLVAFLSTGLSLLLAPTYYTFLPPVVDLNFNGLYVNPIWVIDTLQEAIFISLVGVFVLLIGLQVFNGLAWISGQFARVMLGNFSKPKASIVPAAVAVAAMTATSVEPAALESPAVDAPVEVKAAPTMQVGEGEIDPTPENDTIR